MKPVVHLELHTGDLQGARALSTPTCSAGSRSASRRASAPTSRSSWDAGSAAGSSSARTDRALWLPYVEVAEIGAATEGARASGAAVLLEPREGPAGWRSVVATPAGGEIALWQPKR